jgi:hypothetical protein
MMKLNSHLLATLLSGVCQSALAIGVATSEMPSPATTSSAPAAAPKSAAPATAESIAKQLVQPETKSATLPTGAKSATKLELDAMRTQNALAAERAKAMGADGGRAMGTGPLVPAAEARPIPVEPASGRTGGAGSSLINSARVTMVAGPSGQLAATIATANGLVVARAGERVPGLGLVRTIAINQVLVEDGKQTVSLPFSAEPASNLIQGGPGANGGR